MAQKPVRDVRFPNPPSDAVEHVGGSVLRGSNKDRHPHVVAIEQGHQRGDGTVDAGRGQRDGAKQGADGIVVRVAVHRSLKAIPSPGARCAGTGERGGVGRGHLEDAATGHALQGRVEEGHG